MWPFLKVIHFETKSGNQQGVSPILVDTCELIRIKIQHIKSAIRNLLHKLRMARVIVLYTTIVRLIKIKGTPY